MSEFCEHVEWNVIGFSHVSREDAQALRERGCELCKAGANDTTVGPPVRFKCLDCGRERPLGRTLCGCKR